MNTKEILKAPSKEALALAARAWCTNETKNIPMDGRLAVAFARILDEYNFTNQLNTSFDK